MAGKPKPPPTEPVGDILLAAPKRWGSGLFPHSKSWLKGGVAAARIQKRPLGNDPQPAASPSLTSNGESGFSLIELTVSLMVFGLLLSASLPLYRAQKWAHNLQTTRTHQEQILYALAAFVQTHGRLPCPADPKGDGSERGRCQTPSLAQGIIPFATLGLNSRIAQDGQHQFFRYGVHPQLTLTQSNQEFCCRPLKHLLIKHPPETHPFDPFAFYLIGSRQGEGHPPPVLGTLDHHPVLGDATGENLWIPRQFFAAFYGRLFCSAPPEKEGS